MKRRLIILVLTGLAVVAVIGAVSTFAFLADADAKSETFTYQWFAAAPEEDFCGDFPPCPDEATASNGHAIEIRGFGTLQVHPKDVSGGGSFIHKDAPGPGGTKLAEGTFTAVELLNFKSYGPGEGEGIEPEWRAGLARIRIHLVADNGQEADAILSVGCILPGVKIPGGDKVGAGLFEGVKVNVLGGLNFNKPFDEPRITLFVADSNDAP